MKGFTKGLQRNPFGATRETLVNFHAQANQYFYIFLVKKNHKVEAILYSAKIERTSNSQFSRLYTEARSRNLVI